jgi:hypothetical protein
VDFVRAEITVDGATPPDGRSVCYFRISRKLWIPAGWLSARATLTAITANCFPELSACDFRQFGMQDVQRATNQLDGKASGRDVNGHSFMRSSSNPATLGCK